MRISRIEALGGSVPPLKPSIYIWPPLGPAAGPAKACRSDCSSSGSSERASRSLPLSTVAPALFSGPRSTLGFSSSTTTFCCSTAICRRMSSFWSFPAVISTSWVASAKPFAFKVIKYLPGARPRSSYAPERLVLTVTVCPEELLAETVAPGMTAPVGSVISPRKLAEELCANEEAVNSRIRVMKTTSRDVNFINYLRMFRSGSAVAKTIPENLFLPSRLKPVCQ